MDVSTRIVTSEIGTIPYSLVRKRVRNVNLRVRSNGQVVVSASPRVSISFIDNFVASKAPGLLEKTRKTALSKMKMIPINFTDGEPVTCFGEKLELRIVSSDKDDVNVEDGYLIIYQRDINDIGKSKRLFERFVREQVKLATSRAVQKYLPLFESISCPAPSSFSVRKMTTRWGTCHTKSKRITFSLMLFRTPQFLIEYVVAHELTHLIVPNHSKTFYDVLGKVMPDCIERRSALRGY
jgi:predicted metal-dependent hydrolase